MRDSIHQGDSYWLDITGDISGIDATWPGTWSGSWAIVSDLTDAAIAAPLASGALVPYDGVQLPTNVAGKFRLSINKTVSAGVAPGNHYLAINIVNDSTGYSEIISQDRFTIVKAGL